MTAKNKLLSSKAAASMPYPVDTVRRPTKEEELRERRWKAESGLRSIQEAEKVKRDRGLMKDVKALAAEQMQDLKKVAKAK